MRLPASSVTTRRKYRLPGGAETAGLPSLYQIHLAEPSSGSSLGGSSARAQFAAPDDAALAHPPLGDSAGGGPSPHSSAASLLTFSSQAG